MHAIASHYKKAPPQLDSATARVGKLRQLIANYSGANLVGQACFQKAIRKFDILFTIQGLNEHIEMDLSVGTQISNESRAMLSLLARDSFEALCPTAHIDGLFHDRRPVLQIGSGLAARFVEVQFVHDPDS